MRRIFINVFIICCIVVLSVTVFICFFQSKPFQVKLSENESPLFKETLLDLEKECNKTDIPLVDFYYANFIDNIVPEIQNKKHINVLLLGSHKSLRLEELSQFDFIFASTLILSDFLKSQGYKNFLLPAFIKKIKFKSSTCTLHPENKDCYFAVIGKQPEVIDVLENRQIKYQSFLKLDNQIKQQLLFDINHISGVIINDSTSIDDTIDTDSFFLYVIAHQIPILSDNIAKTADTNMNNFNLSSLFNDTLSYYTYESDIADFLDCLECRLKKAEKAYSLLNLLYTTKSVAKYIAYVINNNNPPISYQSDLLSITVPVHAGLYSNGDYWLATDMEKAFDKLYHNVFLTFYLSTYPYPGDMSIYLRGTTPLQKNLRFDKTISLMYLIFPFTDKRNERDYVVSMHNEFNQVDAVVMASKRITTEAKKQGVNAYYVPQFTNTQKFYVDIDEALKSEVLFVGQNDFYRKAAPTIYEAGLPISIYGPKWTEGMSKAQYIDNKILRKYYSSAKIVLNDTRPDMRKLGFISNRIFDATACGTLVISDYMPEIEEIYGDAVPMWETEEELINLVKYYLNPEHENERKEKAELARQITLKNFTSDIAAQKFKQIIDEIKKQKKL